MVRFIVGFFTLLMLLDFLGLLALKSRSPGAILVFTIVTMITVIAQSVLGLTSPVTLVRFVVIYMANKVRAGLDL